MKNKPVTNIILGFILLFACILASSCHEIPPGPQPPKTTDTTNHSSTIKAVGGISQMDTIGHALADSIIVKINEPGSSFNKLFVNIFQSTLCGPDSVSQHIVVNGGTVSYKWTLSAKPGVQTLTFRVTDQNKKVIDSLNVTATAIPPSRGWHRSLCLPAVDGLFGTTFGKTSTGRIFMGLPGNFYPYYSDDNGVTWHPLPGYYQGYYPWAMKTMISPQDELFFASEIDGVFYSNDQGKSFSNRSNGLVLPYHSFSDMMYLPDNRLLYLTKNDGIYISTNKGLQWNVITPDRQNVLIIHYYAGIVSNGDIYLIEANSYGNLVKVLDHATQTLTQVTNLPAIALSTFYVDTEGNFYAGGYNAADNSAELYQSAGAGTAWKKVFGEPEAGSIGGEILNLSKQGDGNYYFWCQGQTYFKTADFKTFSHPAATDIIDYRGQYILASNGYFITTAYPNMISYYVP